MYQASYIWNQATTACWFYERVLYGKLACFAYCFSLFTLHEKGKYVVFFALLHQIIAGLAGEGLKIAHRTGIGCLHTQNLPSRHVGQGLLGFQYWQGAVQASCIEVFTKFHSHTIAPVRGKTGILPPNKFTEQRAV